METKFNIDDNIYKKNIIEEAINDFEEVAKIIINNNELTIVGDSNEEINETFNEFMNYIIGLMSERNA